ncbi:MAG: exonuclease SbcCD subunit D [Lachnospiraceae bacterium]|nr:exonuclease SbcCD subunit D [Lachnospiraceae bacterium]
MRIFHLSDLHIGLRLLHQDLREDQEHIFRQIVDMAVKHQPDAIVIAGDIYDKSVPSAEAVELFSSFVERLREALSDAVIMMISGNHDSASRIDCFRRVLSAQKVYMIGKPPVRAGESVEKVTLQDAYGNVHFYLLPFVKPSMVRGIVGEDAQGEHLSYHDAVRKILERENINTGERNVIVSHQFYLPKGVNASDVERMESEIRTVGDIDEVGADVLDKFDYAALGHIHKPMRVGSDVIRYCGTPLACSVSEAGQEKGILMVDMQEKGKVTVTKLPLTPLRQIRVVKGELEEVLQQACEDYVTVILTDKADLAVIDMRERLYHAFPYLLEIRRENGRRTDYSRRLHTDALLNPFELCCSFMGELDEKDQEIMQDVINTVKGVM